MAIGAYPAATTAPVAEDLERFRPRLSFPFARGDGSVRLPIPALVGLVGSSLNAQAVLADAGGAFAGIAALTGGLQMLIAR